MQKKWVNKESPELSEVQALANLLNINSSLASILLQRNINTLEEARIYFRPSLDHLHDPFLMKNMAKAVETIEKVIGENNGILIYGDYDVDGTTAVALVYGFLKPIYDNIEYYIPDRYTEGYGLSETGLQYALKNDFKLIITLDCGIKAVDLVTKGKSNGLEFIICDHHLPGNHLPPAAAVLDPKQKDCSYPYQELSGCGVGFKLIQAISLSRGVPIESTYEFLDLVAVSIAADIVPITGENRVLSYFGLRKLNKKPRLGLKALLEIGGITQQVGISEVVFGLAPRINAAGRIDHARSAVELLLSNNIGHAKQWADSVNQNNKSRKEKDTNITKEALAMIAEISHQENLRSTVLYKKDWHKGVIGIVASRCIEKYYKPTIILTHSQEKATGSARSVPGFDIYEAISSCSDLLDAFGGHKYAAGLTLPIERVEDFQRKFEEVVSATISEDLLFPILEIDCELDLDSIDDKFFGILRQMGPFGPGNMPPVFRTRGLKAFAQPKILKEEHLKFRVKSSSGKYFDGLAFGLSRYADALQEGGSFDLAYTLEMNSFRGEQSLQLMVKDIKLDS